MDIVGTRHPRGLGGISEWWTAAKSAVGIRADDSAAAAAEAAGSDAGSYSSGSAGSYASKTGVVENEGTTARTWTFDAVDIYGRTNKPLPGKLTPGGAVALAAGAAASGALIPGVIGGVLWAMKKKDGAKVAFIVAGIFAAISASGAVVAGQSLADQDKLRF